MPVEYGVYRGPNGIGVAFTDQRITGWGGLAIVARCFEAAGLRRVLKEPLPEGRTSPNQVPVGDMAMAPLVTILMGGRRFAHVERFRSDAVLPELFEVKRTPSAMTVTRFFRGFPKGHLKHLVGAVDEGRGAG